MTPVIHRVVKYDPPESKVDLTLPNTTEDYED